MVSGLTPLCVCSFFVLYKDTRDGRFTLNVMWWGVDMRSPQKWRLPFVQAATVDVSESAATGQATVSPSSPALNTVKPHVSEVWVSVGQRTKLDSTQGLIHRFLIL